MSFTGSLVKHEQVVAIERGTGQIVDARAKNDVTLQLGGLAYLDLSIVRGLPVESAVINVNVWDVYRTDDPALIDILLDRVFTKEEA
jgi:hypothetical protein